MSEHDSNACARGWWLPTQVTLLVAGMSVITTLMLAFTAPDPFYLAPFRESQTAISAEYLLKEPAGGMLAYQIPVLGAPWRLPHEFPLFQQLTVWIAQLGIPVAQAGRFLSMLCFILCLWVAWRLWKDWGLSGNIQLIAMALLIASPVYCIYATSHMIESLALLFALLHLWTGWRFKRNLQWRWFVLALITGVLAALIKITTWLPAGALVVFWGLLEFRQTQIKGEAMRRWHGWIGLFVISGSSFIAGVLWSEWAAEVRRFNPFGGEISTASWVFGTMAQRLSLKNWVLVAGKHLLLLFGPIGLLVPALVAAALWKGSRDQTRFFLLISLSAYVIHIIVFLSLHLRHDYYVFGAGVFLIGAVVFALISLQEAKPSVWVRWCPVALALSMSVGSFFYLTVKRNYRDLASEEAIKVLKNVQGSGALLMFGFDWNPRVAYAVGHKALMVVDSAIIPKALEANKKTPFAAAVVLGSADNAIADSAAEKVGLDIAHKFYFWKNGYVLLPPGAKLPLQNGMQENPLIKELEMRVASQSQLSDGLVYRHLSFAGGSNGWFEIIVKRGADAFYIHNLSLIRVRQYFEEK